MEGNRITILLMCGMGALSLCVNAQRTPHSEPFVVDTLMAHDPVMGRHLKTVIHGQYIPRVCLSVFRNGLSTVCLTSKDISGHLM